MVDEHKFNMHNKEDFEAFVGDTVFVDLLELGKMGLVLKEVRALPVMENVPDHVRSHPFMLFFHGPLDPAFRDGTLMVSFGEQDPMMLFIQADLIEEDHIVYTITFS